MTLNECQQNREKEVPATNRQKPRRRQRLPRRRRQRRRPPCSAVSAGRTDGGTSLSQLSSVQRWTVAVVQAATVMSRDSYWKPHRGRRLVENYVTELYFKIDHLTTVVWSLIACLSRAIIWKQWWYRHTNDTYLSLYIHISQQETDVTKVINGRGSSSNNDDAVFKQQL